MDQDKIVVEAKNLWRSYPRGAETVHALADFNLTVRAGEMMGIVGRSGSGKTTFLNQVGCLDTPTEGSLKVMGVEVTKMSEKELVEFRRDNIGFIFQLFYLIPTLTVWENVELPLIFARKRDRERVEEVLEKVGLIPSRYSLPVQLSSGDMQRVAIARALINEPKLLLADEPTGRLERQSKETILNIFKQLTSEGLTILLATHDLEQAQYADRVVELSDGRIIAEHEPKELITLKG